MAADRASANRVALPLALTMWLASASGAPVFSSPDELLDPDKAFRISARALDGKSVQVDFKIARGYYLYRNRFRFATEAGKPIAEVEIPRGKVKEDKFFGKTETFRDLVSIRVMVSPEDTTKGSINLKVTSQGCADVGVCYAPHEQIVRVRLPKGSSP